MAGLHPKKSQFIYFTGTLLSCDAFGRARVFIHRERPCSARPGGVERDPSWEALWTAGVVGAAGETRDGFLGEVAVVLPARRRAFWQTRISPLLDRWVRVEVTTRGFSLAGRRGIALDLADLAEFGRS